VIRRLALVGLGLLGGSVAKAARADGLADEIVAVGRDRARLEPALRDGVVDRISTRLEEGVAGADFCLLATPVATLTALLPVVWHALPADAVLTDVGSTKGFIVETAEGLARNRPLAFVGSHPMAGSEQSGYRVARPDLFRGATVVLTPTERTDSHAVKRVGGFWESLGGRLVTLDPQTHDRATAAISHLPHLGADALVDAVVRMDPRFFEIAGRGFKDTTRIAASDPQMWREIFQENRAGLAEALAAFRAALDELERLIDGGDAAAIEGALDRIRRTREHAGAHRG
jgi:prephenate dehydrogenase